MKTRDYMYSHEDREHILSVSMFESIKQLDIENRVIVTTNRICSNLVVMTGVVLQIIYALLQNRMQRYTRSLS